MLMMLFFCGYCAPQAMTQSQHTYASIKNLAWWINNNEYEFIGLYAARARRIAATYARFYLETEGGGDTDKLGCYCWMALGALIPVSTIFRGNPCHWWCDGRTGIVTPYAYRYFLCDWAIAVSQKIDTSNDPQQ